MIHAAYLATGPGGGRLERVRLRILAQSLESDPDHLEVVIQSVDRKGPLAIDPIHREQMTPHDFDESMRLSREEGWSLSPCPWTAACADRRACRVQKARLYNAEYNRRKAA